MASEMKIEDFFSDGAYTYTEKEMTFLKQEIENMQNTMSTEENDTISIYVELILPTILRLTTELCYGCQVSHPSQIQHDVCMMTPFGVFLRNRLSTALSLIPAQEVNKIARNRACGWVAVDIPLENSVWKDKWTLLTEARVLYEHFTK